jgi:hypothetical protein
MRRSLRLCSLLFWSNECCGEGDRSPGEILISIGIRDIGTGGCVTPAATTGARPLGPWQKLYLTTTQKSNSQSTKVEMHRHFQTVAAPLQAQQKPPASRLSSNLWENSNALKPHTPSIIVLCGHKFQQPNVTTKLFSSSIQPPHPQTGFQGQLCVPALTRSTIVVSSFASGVSFYPVPTTVLADGVDNCQKSHKSSFTTTPSDKVILF